MEKLSAEEEQDNIIFCRKTQILKKLDTQTQKKTMQVLFVPLNLIIFSITQDDRS